MTEDIEMGPRPTMQENGQKNRDRGEENDLGDVEGLAVEIEIEATKSPAIEVEAETKAT